MTFAETGAATGPRNPALAAMPTGMITVLTTLLLATLLASCSGEGEQIVDPDARERSETIFLTAGADASRLDRYREATSELVKDEFTTVNGTPLGLGVDFAVERYDRLWLVDGDGDVGSDQIVVSSVIDRTELGRIARQPGDSAKIIGLAFSNLSQAWTIAHGMSEVRLIDALNVVAVRSVPLPGEPTSIATADNRVFVGIEKADGSGAVVMFRSNDPDLEVSTVADVRRPPIHLSKNSDDFHLVGIIPGEESDIGSTPEVDTDPALLVIDLATLDVVFDGRFISPNLREHVGAFPSFAAPTKDFFIFLATNEGIKRVDTKSWGRASNVTTDGTGYAMVAADYFTELVWAVPSGRPTAVDRIAGDFTRLESLTFDDPITAMVFVGTGRVDSN